VWSIHPHTLDVCVYVGVPAQADVDRTWVASENDCKCTKHSNYIHGRRLRWRRLDCPYFWYRCWSVSPDKSIWVGHAQNILSSYEVRDF